MPYKTRKMEFKQSHSYIVRLKILDNHPQKIHVTEVTQSSILINLVDTGVKGVRYLKSDAEKWKVYEDLGCTMPQQIAAFMEDQQARGEAKFKSPKTPSDDI